MNSLLYSFELFTFCVQGHNDWRVKYPAVQSHMKHAVKVIKSTLKRSKDCYEMVQLVLTKTDICI